MNTRIQLNSPIILYLYTPYSSQFNLNRFKKHKTEELWKKKWKNLPTAKIFYPLEASTRADEHESSDLKLQQKFITEN